jgi:hypothetical protein
MSNIKAKNIGVVGDTPRISGGIHFHNYGDSKDQTVLDDMPFQDSPHRQPNDHDPVLMRILHLSDLHFGTKADAQRWSGQLADDLQHELCCDRVDAMIISGDVANLAVEAEYAAARIFFEQIREEFHIDKENLVIVPGNHDLNWKLSKKGYTLKDTEDVQERLKEGEYIPIAKDVVRLKNDNNYKKRFLPFSRFFEQVTGVVYPLDYVQQGMIYHLKEHNLIILGLNSAWQVDHHFNARVGICDDALNLALKKIRHIPDHAQCLKLAVWHHPINSAFADRVIDHGFMERLAQNNFSICFHGHLHKSINGLFRYDHSIGGRKIEIVGAGTFGAPPKEWTYGYPLQYNLLKITCRQLIVETRCRVEINGAWKPDARWSQGPGKDPLPRYAIDLNQEFKKKSL